MKDFVIKNSKVIGLTAGALLLGALGFAVWSGCTSSKVAIVHVDEVLAASSAIKELRVEEQAKVAELQKFLDGANAEIEKQYGQKAKTKLRDQYAAEFAQKQHAMQAEYAAKLQVVTDRITRIVEKTAAKGGYNLVLTKNVVVSGGADITQKVIEALDK